MASKMYEVAFQLGAKIQASFGNAFNTASNRIKSLEAESKAANKGFLGLGEGGTKVFKAASGLIGGIGFAEAAKQSVMLASDLTEVQNVVDTTFGSSSKQINAWSSTALKGFGLSELQAKQFNGTMGALMKSSGITGNSLVKMSENLTGLSGDFASFYNLPIGEAFEKIKSGISGETEPLKSLGINMSEANLQAFALTQGITKPFQKMSQGEQTLLRYNYLMNVSKDVQGDFTKTSNTFANQLRIAKTSLAQTGATIGSKVLPMLNNLLLAFNNGAMGNLGPILDKTFKAAGTAMNFAKQHAELFKAALLGIASSIAVLKTSATISNVFKSFSDGVKDVKTATGLISNLGRSFNTLKTGGGAIRAISQAFGIANPTILIVVASIAAVSAAAYLIYKNWGPISKFFSNVWSNVKSVFNSFWNWLKSFIGTWGPTILAITVPIIGIPLLIAQHWGQIKPKLSAIWNSLKNSVSNAWASIVKTISSVLKTVNTVVSNGWKTIIKAITSSALFKVVSAVFKGILAVTIIFVVNQYNRIVTGWTRIFSAVSSVLSRIWQVISRIWNSIYITVSGVVIRVWNYIVSVWNTMYGTVSGIMTRVWSVIVSIWNSVYRSVSNIVTTIWNVIVRIWNAIYTSVSSVLTTIWTFIVNVWNNVYSSISGIVTTIWNTIVNGFNSAASGVISIFTNMYNSIVNIFSGIWSAIKSIINGGINMLNGFIGGVNNMISKANSIPGVHIGTVGTIPQLATGGYVKHRPGGILANIGEGSEDEIVSPVSKLRSIIDNVFTNQKSTTVNNQEQPNINFTVNVTIQGNASKSDVYEAITMSKHQIEKVIDEYFNKRKRLSFDS